MFFYLIIGVIVLSAILSLMGVSVTEQIAVPVPVEVTPDFYEDVSEYTLSGVGTDDVEYEIKEQTIAIESLLSIDGIRFLFTSFVSNFQGFGALAVTLIAMMGAGAAEVAGLMAALIRKLVKVAPRALIAYLIVFVGVLSSVASDAGYLILIPLGAAAFLAVGRHPIAGLAAGFGGVAAVFMANLIPTPTDAMLFEITNEVHRLGRRRADLHHGRLLLPGRLGPPDDRGRRVRHRARRRAAPGQVRPGGSGRSRAGRRCRRSRSGPRSARAAPGRAGLPGRAGRRPARHPAAGRAAARSRNGRDHRPDALHEQPAVHRHAVLLHPRRGLWLGGRQVQGAQRRDRRRGQDLCRPGRPDLHAVDDQPVHRLLQLLQPAERHRHCAGRLAGTGRHSGDPAVGRLRPGDRLLDFIMPGSLAKWAIFAPIFVPLFIRLDVPAQTVFAAYRVGDSPINTLTPLMVYFPVIVAFAQRYQKSVGVGSLVALMLPIAAIRSGRLAALAHPVVRASGIPLGPDSFWVYPVHHTIGICDHCNC
jgi:hypothetical protein